MEIEGYVKTFWGPSCKAEGATVLWDVHIRGYWTFHLCLISGTLIGTRKVERTGHGSSHLETPSFAGGGG